MNHTEQNLDPNFRHPEKKKSKNRKNANFGSFYLTEHHFFPFFLHFLFHLFLSVKKIGKTNLVIQLI